MKVKTAHDTAWMFPLNPRPSPEIAMKLSSRQHISSFIRLWKARMKGGKLSWGRNVYVGPGTTIRAVKDLAIADAVYIGRNCTIEVAGCIGSGCLIANNVGIVGRRDHDPNFNGDMFFAPHADIEPRLRSEVEIGAGSWIGFGAVILGPVKIGPRSIISAGSVVTKDVPAGSIFVNGTCRPRQLS